MDKKLKKIVWISSYPKSGNTWLRAIVSSLLHTSDGVFKFELLKLIPVFENLDVCVSCNHHFRMSINRRIETLFGNENFNNFVDRLTTLIFFVFIEL